MQLGEIIGDFSDESKANEALLACDDLALLACIAKAADHYEETAGDYAPCAVRRFANQAASEDWLSLMNVIERADDPGIDCLTYMIKWSLKQDEESQAVRSRRDCGGGGGCA
jgi:hypothetical protein